MFLLVVSQVIVVAFLGNELVLRFYIDICWLIYLPSCWIDCIVSLYNSQRSQYLLQQPELV